MTSRDKVLSYIFKFATEEGLDDLTEFLAENYPVVTESSRLNIPPGGFYAAIEQLETQREQDATKEVRALLTYYDQILDLPQTEEGLTLCGIPEERFKHTAQNVEKFPFTTNVLSATHHPQLPNLVITTSSTKDVTITYIPTAPILDSITNEPVKPVVVARFTALHAIALTTHPFLVVDEVTNQYSMYILVGGIDGGLTLLSLPQIPSEWFADVGSQDQLSADGTTNITNLANFHTKLSGAGTTALELVQIATIKPHQRYLTRISTQQQTFPLTSFQTGSSITITTASHDQNIAFMDLSLERGIQESGIQVTQDKANLIILKEIEFKGKIEAMCPIETPISYQNGFHPVLLYPNLIPTATPSRYYQSTVRKLHKGHYLDSVEFISPSVPFTLRAPNSPSQPNRSNLIVISVRNDPNLHIIDVEKMAVVDKINVNINGDDHVSFAILDIAYDPYYGLLYLATDVQTILIMDTITKQHIRRLYCTDNNDLSSPILKLIKVPSFSLNPQQIELPQDDDNCKSPLPGAMIEYAPYRTLVAITTGKNSVKVYNQHTQVQIVEFQSNTKNIKGFVVIPSSGPLEPFTFVSTGFDKTFSVYF